MRQRARNRGQLSSSIADILKNAGADVTLSSGTSRSDAYHAAEAELPLPPATSTHVATQASAPQPVITSDQGSESELPRDPDWFASLSAKRRGWWESTRDNEFEHGIRQSTVDKYADPAHFLYELLQNAEDQKAQTARFILKKDALVFAHTGEGFTRRDVVNITGVGISQKLEQANKIGRFGIGFKSVFTVTDRPRVYTYLEGVPFAFAIENLVVPVLLEDKISLCDEKHTRFTLPFSTNAGRADVYTRIAERLRNLTSDTLLFLTSLKCIEWSIEDGSNSAQGVLRAKRDEAGHVVRLNQEITGGGKIYKSPEVEYLVYSRQLTQIKSEDRKLSVSIAYRCEKGRIVAEPGQQTANVYFPTREKTGLKFRLHAPFLLNDSRANIKDNSPENTLLVKVCADLFFESLPDLKKRELLTGDAVNLLPIRAEDFNGSPFRPIYEAMFRAAQTLEILPAQTGSSKTHVSAARAKISDSKPLKVLLGEAQLTALYSDSPRDPICWLHESIQKTVTPDLWNFLMRILEIDEVDSSKFARRLDAAFLAAQTDEWMRGFYTLLNDQPALWRAGSVGQRGPLRSKPIIRLEAGTGPAHIAPFAENGMPNVYLPLKTETTGFPVVKRVFVRDADSLAFLQALGLKPPDVVDSLTQHILPRYERPLSVASIDAQGYAHDIKEIADVLEGLPSGSPQRHALTRKLRNTAFVRAVCAGDATQTAFKRPAEVYQRTEDTVEWFSGNKGAWVLCPTLEALPQWNTLQKSLSGTNVLAPLPRVRSGVADERGQIELENRHGAHKRGLAGFDSAADIDGLEHALRAMNPRKAKLLWRLLCQNAPLISGTVESSRYAAFTNSERAEQDSKLGEVCKNARWVPCKGDSKMHLPARIRLCDLPDDWDRRSAGAKEAALRLCLSNPEEEQIAEKLGVPLDVLARLAEEYKRDPRSTQEFLARRRAMPEMPEADAPYTERRASKVEAEVHEAAVKEYETRDRSVRVGAAGVREEARVYLRALYTNRDQEMICQLCRDAMPFRVKDGSYYFEAVTCFRNLTKEVKHNFLALCPLCAALYQHGNWENERDAFAQAMEREPGPQFSLILAGKEQELWFHEHHLKDLAQVRKTLNQ